MAKDASYLANLDDGPLWSSLWSSEPFDRPVEQSLRHALMSATGISACEISRSLLAKRDFGLPHRAVCHVFRADVKFLLRIPTFGHAMHVSEKGQVTIPKHIRIAAGVAAGSEVSFSLEGSKIVITPVATGLKDDRRAKLRVAAARVRASLSPDFRQLGADAIMAFLRGDEAPPKSSRRGPR